MAKQMAECVDGQKMFGRDLNTAGDGIRDKIGEIKQGLKRA